MQELFGDPAYLLYRGEEVERNHKKQIKIVEKSVIMNVFDT